MSGTILLLTPLALLAQVELPGTQPNELLLPPEPSSTCGCHDGYDPVTSVEPSESYRATAMALAARDPVFRAAFQVARQDRPDLTDLCLRCHAPTAWLNGRSEGDLEELTTSDMESVTCDICHRMESNEPYIGSGQFKIAPSTAKRSRRGSAPFGGHAVLQTPFVSTAEMCGACHSLFNPAEQAHDERGNVFPFPYYEQRTYEEWKDSKFAADDVTCIDCHMKTTRGQAVRDGQTYDDLQVHSFVGGNVFTTDAVRILNPDLALGREAEQVREWVEESLESAAELTTTTGPINVDSGAVFGLDVRLTNKTGHKLPSGYPEGRRVYLSVTLELDGQAPQVLSGAWDEASGVLIHDPQIRTYETEHGRYENGASIRTRRLLLMNQVLLDTRLPPEGFNPSFPDMTPVGRDYGAAPPYRHWDDVSYEFTAPEVAVQSQGQIVVRAMYQETDGDVVRFLVNAVAGTQEATDLQTVYDRLGHAPPHEMISISVPVTIQPAASSDGGSSGSPDGGTQDATSSGPPSVRSGGCLSAVSPGSSLAPSFVMLTLVLVWRRRRRRTRD